MAITGYTSKRVGNVTTITVTTDIIGAVWFLWYLDGSFVGRTIIGERSFQLDPDDQWRVDVIDTADENLDPIANAPIGYPSRRTLRWYGAGLYELRQVKDGGAATVLARFDTVQFFSTWLTERLVDQSTYTWSIFRMDSRGYYGFSAAVLGPEKVVRWPNAPRWTHTFDSGTARVTFAAA